MSARRARRALERVEKVAQKLRLEGCPACRGRQGRIVWLDEEEPPGPCEACGEVPDYFFIETVGPEAKEDEL